MKLCEENNFDLLLTIDKNFLFQQNIEKHLITIVVFDTYSSKIEELLTFLPSFKSQMAEMKKSKAYLNKKITPKIHTSLSIRYSASSSNGFFLTVRTATSSSCSRAMEKYFCFNSFAHSSTLHDL